MQIRVLGGLEIIDTAGRPLELPAGKARLLAGYLAMTASRPTPRERLAAWLWPDANPARARANLRQTLLLMRKPLGDALKADGYEVWLIAEVDALQFETLATSTAAADRQRAELLYTGPLLDGQGTEAEYFEQWLRETRERLHGLARELLLALTAERADYGDFAGALAAGERLLRLEPSCEAAHCALMRLHQARGARDAVLRQYQRLQQALLAELGLAPAASSSRLRDELLAAPTAGAVHATRRTRAPGVAVMPFANASGDAADDYYVDGLAEDIIAGLARYRSLRVAARHSTHAYRQRAVPAPQIGRELDTDYLFEASVRRHGAQLRINTLLVEAASGQHVWSERFEGSPADWFEFQDQLVSKIVSSLAATIEAAAFSGSRHKPPQSLDVYDRWLHGLHHLRRGSVADDVIARQHFERALALDPLFARAHAGLSLSHFNEWSCQIWNEWDMRQRLAYDHAARAAELDEADHVTHCVLGKVLLYRRELALAERHLDRSLALNANDADTLALIAPSMTQLGRLEEGALLAERAMELNPRPPNWYFPMIAICHYFVADIPQAHRLLAQAPTRFVDGALIYALFCQRLGDGHGAQHWRRVFLQEFETKILFGRRPEPDEHLRWLDRVMPFRHASHRQRLFDDIHTLEASAAAVS